MLQCFSKPIFSLVIVSRQTIQKMRSILKFFQSELDHYLSCDTYLDCRVCPQKLLKELKSEKDIKRLSKILHTPQTNPIKIMKVLTLCNLLTIYTNDFYDLIENYLVNSVSKDEWINEKCFQPYFRYLIKICKSRDMFMAAKTFTIKKLELYELLFYTINMLKQLFVIVHKMPLLGRYYKPKYSNAVSTFVEVIAIAAQRLYSCFKYCLGEIIIKRETYIKNKDDESILRGVFSDELTFINEEMKKLFLDKYFYPLGKGIGVKLFRPQQQSQQCETVINSIINNHLQSERRRQRQELQNTLFPQSGVINYRFYEQTLLGGPMSVLEGSRLKEKGIKDLQDIVLSQGDEQEDTDQIQKSNEKQQLQKKEVDADTNTGTKNIIGNVM